MFEVSIIIPINYTIHLNRQGANSNIDQMIDELIELSGKLKCEIIEKDFIIYISYDKSEKRKGYFLPNKFLVFTIKNINYKDFPLELDYENYEEDSKYMFQNMVISDFTKRIYDLVVAVNIAIVGSLDCDDGTILIDGKVVDKTKRVKPELCFVSEYVKKFRWPTIKRLSILDTWNWLSKNEGYCNGVGGSSLDRSLSAFSYLFHTDNSNGIADLDMFWTMVGIEALYANNSFGVKDQIIEKTQIVLGELVDNKKAFKAIYDVRSRLVHGDMNFPGKFHIYDAQIEYENYYDKMDKATLLAKAILIATYQFMVENKIHNLNFKYNLDL